MIRNINIIDNYVNDLKNKPSQRDILSTNYNINHIYILTDIFNSNTPPQAQVEALSLQN
jgi:hypothetical protein